MPRLMHIPDFTLF